MSYTIKELERFVEESNRIEGILELREREIEASREFLAGNLTVEALEKVVSVLQPGAKLRDRPGMNVRVGTHVAPLGGPLIRRKLEELLRAEGSPFETHVAYETLHPFMDGNGRSGRLVWAWQMLRRDQWPGIRLGFLHAFYYQTLSTVRGKEA